MCFECDAEVDEENGRWLLLNQSISGNFTRRFLCIQCVRDWRRRCLEREGLSTQRVMFQLDIEFPLIIK